MSAANQSAHALHELVDAAVEKLLQNTPVASLIGELHQLRSDNVRLQASLLEVQNVDDAEISRLWGTIEELELKIASHGKLITQQGGANLTLNFPGITVPKQFSNV